MNAKGGQRTVYKRAYCDANRSTRAARETRYSAPCNTSADPALIDKSSFPVAETLSVEVAILYAEMEC